MPISSQYVFELQFFGVNYGEKQFVIVDGESMADFSKLKDDLSKCTPDPFRVQYIDDEDDIISIDTEEEFIEFAKLAKQRSSKGMLIKLILNSYDLPSDTHSDFEISSQPATETKQPSNAQKRDEKKLEVGVEEASGSNDMAIGSENSDYTWISKKQLDLMMEELSLTLNHPVPEKVNEAIKKAAAPDLPSSKSVTKGTMMVQSGFDKFMSRIKADLKEEILSEMKIEMSGSNDVTGTKSLQTSTEYEEDSDGNLVLEKRKAKNLQYQKKLEKKEKISETKIDQRIEKLELKKKKLLEKSLRINRKPVTDFTFDLPSILSAIATADSSTLPKKVTIGKVFVHVWQLVNDGTSYWNYVELRHTWSSPGLEPDELSIKCSPTAPGAESTVMMRFKAPKTVGPFISYWHFYHQVGCQWMQFGHYVSVTGHTKMPKLAVSTGIKVTDVNRKLKHDGKTVTFIEKERENTTKEVKVVNGETEMTLKKQLEASLASSEIAAEMAREAANAAFRRAFRNQAATINKPDVSKQAEKEHIVSSVQHLNLEESGSDTDANLDTNEEVDPGFVVVNLPSSFTSSDNTKTQNIILEAKPSVDLSGEGAGTNNINTENKDENTETLVKEEKKNGATLSKTGGTTYTFTNGQGTSWTWTDKELLTGKVNGPNLLGSSVPDNHAPIPEAFEKQDEPQVFPRLDRGVNYTTMYTPSRSHIYPVPPHHPTHNQPFGPVPIYNGPPIIPAPGPAPMPHFVPPPPPPKMVPSVMAYQYPMSAHPSANVAIHAFPPTPTSQMVYPQMNPPVSSESFPMGPPIFQGYRKYPYPSPSTLESNVKMVYTPASPENTPPTNTFSETTTASNFSENQQEAAQPQPETQPEQVNQPAAAAQQQTEAPPRPQPMTQPQPNGADKKAESDVQILPQGLVDGAINVAASAYSTAWNALNNLRPKEGVAVEFDPVFENNMALLVEMGFNNLERNAMLLKRFNNDVSQVIGVICATGGGEGLNID